MNIISQQNKELSPDIVLSKALLNAGKALNLTQTELARMVGKEKNTLKKGIEPESASGQLASLIIQLHGALYVLVGGKKNDVLHWLQTENLHTKGIPIEQIKTVTGLNEAVNHLGVMHS